MQRMRCGREVAKQTSYERRLSKLTPKQIHESICTECQRLKLEEVVREPNKFEQVRRRKYDATTPSEETKAEVE